MFRSIIQKTSLLAAAVLAMAAPALGAPISININTSSLSGSPLTLALGYTDGSPGAAVNTVVSSGFAFGGGSIVGGTADCTLGGSLSGVGCSGDLSTAITLSDAAFDPLVDSLAYFTQRFIAGSSLSFIVNSTAVPSVPPDQFSVSLCDATLSLCYSDDPITGALMTMDIVGSSGAPFSFTTHGSTAPLLPPPTVTAGAPTAVPEPATLLLLGTGIATAISRRRR